MCRRPPDITRGRLGWRRKLTGVAGKDETRKTFSRSLSHWQWPYKCPAVFIYLGVIRNFRASVYIYYYSKVSLLYVCTWKVWKFPAAYEMSLSCSGNSNFGEPNTQRMRVYDETIGEYVDQGEWGKGFFASEVRMMSVRMMSFFAQKLAINVSFSEVENYSDKL